MPFCRKLIIPVSLLLPLLANVICNVLYHNFRRESGCLACFARNSDALGVCCHHGQASRIDESGSNLDHVDPDPTSGLSNGQVSFSVNGGWTENRTGNRTENQTTGYLSRSRYEIVCGRG